jgi:glutamate-1-semialdehyde 2,1-aminomutase
MKLTEPWVGAVVDILRQEGTYQELDEKGKWLADGIQDAAKKVRIPVTINRMGSLLSVFFTNRPIRNFTDVQSTNIGLFKRMFSGLLRKGIYIAPSAYEAMFVSLAHSGQDIQKTVEIVYGVLDAIRR